MKITYGMDFSLLDELSTAPRCPPTYPLNGAILDGVYRYKLWRTWNTSLPKVCWIMLNPSTADASQDDATIKRVTKFSASWGFGGVVVVNLFAYRATDPSDMVKASTTLDVVGTFNDQHIMLAGLECPKLTIAAWGAHGNMLGRAEHVLKCCREAIGGERVLHALKVNQDGTPSHPLYLPDNSTPTTYKGLTP